MTSSKLFSFSLLFYICFFASAQECPKKIKWKRLNKKEDVASVLNSCIPKGSDRAAVTEFLTRQKLKWLESENGVLFFSVLTKSNSVWIEKQWAVKLMLDENQKLVNIEVEEWLTGP